MRTLITCFVGLATVARCSVVPEVYAVVPETAFNIGPPSAEELMKKLSADIAAYTAYASMDVQNSCMVTFAKTNSNCGNVSIAHSCVYDFGRASLQ